MLNLFSFTGAFALRAVRAGAASVTNVDAAARSHAKCRQNLAASGLDPEACEALTGDVFKYLDRFVARKRTFDLVVVDPPPFSNVKGSVFSALRDWSGLIEGIAGVVAPGGLVLAVCNAARLSDAELLEAVGEGSRRASREVRLVGECRAAGTSRCSLRFPRGDTSRSSLEARQCFRLTRAEPPRDRTCRDEGLPASPGASRRRRPRP